VKAGQRAYTSKHCAICHNDPASGAPKLAGRVFSEAGLVSALWHHGPLMLDQMQTKMIKWPRFASQDMGNLIAYLNSLQGEK
jgi:mono/diheme cytochrome c family protein